MTIVEPNNVYSGNLSSVKAKKYSFFEDSNYSENTVNATKKYNITKNKSNCNRFSKEWLQEVNMNLTDDVTTLKRPYNCHLSHIKVDEK